MTIIDLIGVLSFGIACFSLGYQFGCRDNNKHTKK
jgi:hypothetical protein